MRRAWMTDVTIIIVTWNGKKYVQECLGSLLLQPTNLTLETIVVDNASVDGTPEMVKTEYPYVQVVSNVKNLGFARANNIGMQRSSGKYLCLINSDVVVLPGCVGAMFDFMESHPDIGILGPKALTPNHATARSCMRFPSVINTFARALTVDRILARLGFPVGIEMSDFPHDRMRDVDVLNGWFWMVRKQALQQVGLARRNIFLLRRGYRLVQTFPCGRMALRVFP